MPSEKPYDWLGHGVYFWEEDPVRAWQWATDRPGTRDNPCVVGAVVSLGKCLDLTTQDGIQAVKFAYQGLKSLHKLTGDPLPRNGGKDFGLRRLDCAVIEHLHRAREKGANLPKYQTVRALFVEGRALYPQGGFHAKTHTQLCVRDSSCILGIFRIPKMHRDLLGLPTLRYEDEAAT